MAYEQATTVVGLPSWWDSATTVEIKTIVSGTTATYNTSDVEFFPYGISVPDNPSYTWTAAIIPWGYIASIIKVS
jgi:hypothetical protein